MKMYLALFTGLLLILPLSCENEKAPEPEETGRLMLNIGLSIRVNEAGNHFKAAPGIGEFQVTIFNAAGEEVMVFENASDIPEFVELPAGDYYVEAHSENDLPAAFDNPYYFGTSSVFTLVGNAEESVSVTCFLANTMVSVVYSDQVISHFLAYSTSVASSLDSLIFSETEIRKGYFRTLPLSISVSLDYQKPDGSMARRILQGNIPDPEANKHYEIRVDASIDEGMASFQILLDESEVLVEYIDIKDAPGQPQQGTAAYGDLLITEIMSNPTALSDTEGEWFEIYNASDKDLDLLNMVLERDDLYRHTISETHILAPGAYFVFMRTATATTVLHSYVYGSDILLPNTGAKLAIYNEGDGISPGSLIFSMDYGAAGFPEGSGASICLDPSLLNAGDALLSSSWCVSTSTFSTGDLGSPGSVNDACQ